MWSKKKEKIALSRSMVMAFQLTQAMAEMLVSSPLTLFQAKISAEAIEEQGLFGYAERKLKTDCVFTDDQREQRTVIAWITIIRVGGQWRPSTIDNFIKLDNNLPCRMEFVDNQISQLIISSYDWKIPQHLVETNQLDYSRIN